MTGGEANRCGILLTRVVVALRRGEGGIAGVHG